MNPQNEQTLSRRELLGIAVQLSAIVTMTLAAGGCAKKAPAAICFDADQGGDADIQLRASLNYTEESPDQKQVCGGCAFFQAPPQEGSCGACSLLKGSVNRHGHCTSWSAHS